MGFLASDPARAGRFDPSKVKRKKARIFPSGGFREDGSPATAPPPDQTKATNRRRNKTARSSRKANR